MSKKNEDITLQEIGKLVQDTAPIKVIQSLLDQGLIHIYETLKDFYFPKKETTVYLHSDYQVEEKQEALMKQLEKAPKQLHIFLSFLHLNYQHSVVLKSDLLQRAEADTSIFNQLVKKNILVTKEVDVERMAYEYDGEIKENVLNQDQQEAFHKMENAFAVNKPALLHGVTGSGKTHLYIEWMLRMRKQRKQSLYLLPEIALTAQLIRKIRSYLGDRVGIYHSRFSNQERVEVWQKVLKGEYDVIIGARSALLLPFQNLGLIIVDEEHDASYKQQDPAPRYHARDAALWMASQFGAHIVLGSATPSIESFYNAQLGKYAWVELKYRFGEAQMPDIHLIDAKNNYTKESLSTIVSKPLFLEIEKTLQAKKQVILFQNRRGYAPFILCRQCAWVPHCKYCDVSLTYHKQSDQLHCHYCGSKSPYIKKCLACGSTRMTTSGFGTEKIEEEVRKLFPNARVQRFDWDALRAKGKYQEVIQQFEKQQIDILVGTQMVVKGLDFDHVHLVGVLNADSLLAVPDFRVNERVFQMLEQVSGRAGRKKERGEVLIQLMKLDHPVVQFVQKHDYAGYVRFELQSRMEFHYPPFTRLIKISFKHKLQQKVVEASHWYRQQLSTFSDMEIFGPAEPSIARVKNMYLQEIILKIKRDAQYLHEVKLILKDKSAELIAMKGFSGVIIQVDVDPV